MNIKQSIRIIFRNKTYSLLNIAGLTIGIAVSALLLLWVEYHANNNRDVPNSKNIYEIVQHQSVGDRIETEFSASFSLFDIINSEIPGIRRSSRMLPGGSQNFSFEDENKSISQQGVFVDSALFSMIDLRFTAGNRKTAFAPARPIVVSQNMATTLFGDEYPMGKTLKMDNAFYEVSGVFKDRDHNSSFYFEWLIPFQVHWDDMRSRGSGRHPWGNWFQCFVETYPGVNVATINETLTRIRNSQTTLGNFYNHHEIALYSIKDRWLYGEFKDGIPVGGNIRTIRIFLAISGIILLFACINFVNMSIARNQKRTMEVGVRKAFGAKRFELIRQFMGESAIIVSISLVLSVFFILAFLPAFSEFVSLRLTVDFANLWQTGGLLGVGLLCTLLSSAYPALYLSAFSPINTLKKLKILPTGSAIWARKSLLVFQFAITFIMVSAAAIIYLQIRYLYNRPLGLDANHVVHFNPTKEVMDNYFAVQQQLINSGCVSQVCLSNQLIFNFGNKGAIHSGYDWHGKDPNFTPAVSQMSVGPGMFEMFKIQLLEGSYFTPEYFAENPAKGVIINRSFAEILDEDNRIGGFLRMPYYSESFPIIGIVENFVSGDLRQAKAYPGVFVPSVANSRNMFVRMNDKMPEKEAIIAVQKILQSFSPYYSFDPTYMSYFFDRFLPLDDERYIGKVAGLFSILAVIISCIGLFGLCALEAEKRTREIGIRKVLGASVWSIIRLLGGSFVQLLIVAFVVALPIAWYIGHRWLQDFGYRMSLDWYIFAGAGLLVTLIAMLTVSAQSWKAATANPVKAIKSE